jgi:hypothetical protein
MKRILIVALSPLLLHAVAHAAPVVRGDRDFVVSDRAFVAEQCAPKDPDSRPRIKDENRLRAVLNRAALYSAENLSLEASDSPISLHNAGVDWQRGIYVVSEGPNCIDSSKCHRPSRLESYNPWGIGHFSEDLAIQPGRVHFVGNDMVDRQPKKKDDERGSNFTDNFSHWNSFLVMSVSEAPINQIEGENHESKPREFADRIAPAATPARLLFIIGIVKTRGSAGAELWHRRPFLPSAKCGGELLNFTRRREWLTT